MRNYLITASSWGETIIQVPVTRLKNVKIAIRALQLMHPKAHITVGDPDRADLNWNGSWNNGLGTRINDIVQEWL